MISGNRLRDFLTIFGFSCPDNPQMQAHQMLSEKAPVNPALSFRSVSYMHGNKEVSRY
jgi:hypothetical protein